MYVRFRSPDSGLVACCDSETWELCFVRLAKGAPVKGEPEVGGL